MSTTETKTVQHTPAPWTIAEHNGVRHSGDGEVASVHYTGTVPFTWEQVTGKDRTEYETWSKGTNEANARLIAAAPELLDALADLLDACPTSCEDKRLIDAQKKSEAAIAKAEGR